MRWNRTTGIRGPSGGLSRRSPTSAENRRPVLRAVPEPGQLAVAPRRPGDLSKRSSWEGQDRDERDQGGTLSQIVRRSAPRIQGQVAEAIRRGVKPRTARPPPGLYVEEGL